MFKDERSLFTWLTSLLVPWLREVESEDVSELLDPSVFEDPWLELELEDSSFDVDVDSEPPFVEEVPELSDFVFSWPASTLRQGSI